MEPTKSHDATMSQEDLTRPVEGCMTGLRPADLMQGEHEHVNPNVSLRVTAYEVADNALALQTPGRVLTRLDIFKLLTKLAKTKESKYRPVDIDLTKRTTAISKELNIAPIYATDKRVKEVVSKFTTHCENLYKKCNYTLSKFTKKHQSG